ncbi:hypothetical protein BKA69DRAFT_1169081 [Paraphysoderma sedebokerense]|nr:hypothetical protein BKA69DRAFT_1169081 [Paraphysoderma sedebokerense]
MPDCPPKELPVKYRLLKYLPNMRLHHILPFSDFWVWASKNIFRFFFQLTIFVLILAIAIPMTLSQVTLPPEIGQANVCRVGVQGARMVFNAPNIIMNIAERVVSNIEICTVQGGTNMVMGILSNVGNNVNTGRMAQLQSIVRANNANNIGKRTSKAEYEIAEFLVLALDNIPDNGDAEMAQIKSRVFSANPAGAGNGNGAATPRPPGNLFGGPGGFLGGLFGGGGKKKM